VHLFEILPAISSRKVGHFFCLESGKPCKMCNVRRVNNAVFQKCVENIFFQTNLAQCADNVYHFSKASVNQSVTDFIIARVMKMHFGANSKKIAGTESSSVDA